MKNPHLIETPIKSGSSFEIGFPQVLVYWREGGGNLRKFNDYTYGDGEIKFTKDININGEIVIRKDVIDGTGVDYDALKEEIEGASATELTLQDQLTYTAGTNTPSRAFPVGMIRHSVKALTGTQVPEDFDTGTTKNSISGISGTDQEDCPLTIDHIGKSNSSTQNKNDYSALPNINYRNNDFALQPTFDYSIRGTPYTNEDGFFCYIQTDENTRPIIMAQRFFPYFLTKPISIASNKVYGMIPESSGAGCRVQHVEQSFDEKQILSLQSEDGFVKVPYGHYLLLSAAVTVISKDGTVASKDKILPFDIIKTTKDVTGNSLFFDDVTIKVGVLPSVSPTSAAIITGALTQVPKLKKSLSYIEIEVPNVFEKQKVIFEYESTNGYFYLDTIKRMNFGTAIVYNKNNASFDFIEKKTEGTKTWFQSQDYDANNPAIFLCLRFGTTLS